jgi:hypothetical protein
MNCHITGSLVPPHTGSMLWLSVHDAKYASEINRSGYTLLCYLNRLVNLYNSFQAYVMNCVRLKISSGKSKSRDVDIKIEQSVHDHTTVNNEDTVTNSERPRKSRKRNDDAN